MNSISEQPYVQYFVEKVSKLKATALYAVAKIFSVIPTKIFARKREECNWWFAVDRFIMHDLACYRIQRRQMKNISVNNIISSLHMSTIVYTIELIPEFKKANFMRVIVFSSAYPWNDLDSY